MSRLFGDYGTRRKSEDDVARGTNRVLTGFGRLRQGGGGGGGSGCALPTALMLSTTLLLGSLHVLKRRRVD